MCRIKLLPVFAQPTHMSFSVWLYAYGSEANRNGNARKLLAYSWFFLNRLKNSDLFVPLYNYIFKKSQIQRFHFHSHQFICGADEMDNVCIPCYCCCRCSTQIRILVISKCLRNFLLAPFSTDTVRTPFLSLPLSAESYLCAFPLGKLFSRTPFDLHEIL